MVLQLPLLPVLWPSSLVCSPQVLLLLLLALLSEAVSQPLVLLLVLLVLLQWMSQRRMCPWRRCC